MGFYKSMIFWINDRDNFGFNSRWEELLSILKYQVIRILDYFNYCWCDLVLWSLNHIDLIDVSPMSNCNYCGKCNKYWPS